METTISLLLDSVIYDYENKLRNSECIALKNTTIAAYHTLTTEKCYVTILYLHNIQLSEADENIVNNIIKDSLLQCEMLLQMKDHYSSHGDKSLFQTAMIVHIPLSHPNIRDAIIEDILSSNQLPKNHYTHINDNFVLDTLNKIS